MQRIPLLIATTVTLALSVTAGATASNATLRTTLNTWSKRVGADAGAVATAARQRHPRLMTTNANRFHTDAVRARRALARQSPSTARGRRARRLALRAFTDYALAGLKWAASGRARVAHQRAASIADAKAGTGYAQAANKLLVAAGKLLA